MASLAIGLVTKLGALATGTAATAGTASTIATIAGATGTALSVAGALKGASANKASLKYKSKIERQQADEAKAIGQRKAQAKYREGRLIASRQQAVAGASGGGDDESVINIMGLTAMETDLGARTIISSSQQDAIAYDQRAASSLADARTAGRTGILNALGQGLGGASTMYDRFAKAQRYKPG